VVAEVSVEIIAHRGASYDAPENTLASVRLGWEQGADAVEVDVHLSKDNRIVVVHDADTKRVTGVKRFVRECTLAELQKLDCGKWKAPRWKGERFAPLEDALATIPAGKRMLVEIKSGPEIIPHFGAAINGVEQQVVPIGFDLKTMRLLKKEHPSLETYWVVGWKHDWKRGGWLPKPATMIEECLEAGLDGLDVGANGPLSAGFAKKVKAAGLKLYVWTVDSPAKARKLQVAGVDGIATNRPGYMREKLNELS
jgi:glycerophosphoryl diester phosphodiesterase